MKASEILTLIAQTCDSRPYWPGGIIIQELLTKLGAGFTGEFNRAHKYYTLAKPTEEELDAHTTDDINAAPEIRTLMYLFAAAMAESEGD